MRNSDYTDSPYYLGNRDVPPFKITFETGNATIKEELPWDVSCDDIMRAMYGLLIALGFTEKGVAETMLQFGLERLDTLDIDAIENIIGDYNFIREHGNDDDEVYKEETVSNKESIADDIEKEQEDIKFPKVKEEIVHQSEDTKKTVEVQEINNEPEMVDLGLSVKWAKYNFGATGGSSAESWYGGYYAWAETSGRTVDYEQETCSPSCDFDHYKYYADDEVSKYNETDGLTTLQASDDVITATYGAGYSMPTKAELDELKGLTSEWVTDYQGISGLNGRLFHGTGAYSANTLFIPAAGSCEDGGLYYVANYGCVWSSSLNEDDPECAWYLRFHSGYVNAYDNGRGYGYSVRGVSRA